MTTTQALNKIAFNDGFKDFTALMENASLAYIADRCQKAIELYAQQFIECADCIIIPAMDILPDTYKDELDAWCKLTVKTELK